MQDYFSFIIPLLPYFFQGLLTTIEASLCAILLGIVIALLITVIRLSNCKPLIAVSNVYVSFMRGTPLLVQLFVIFYSISVMGLSLPPFLTGVIALSLNTGAFSAEILRGGLTSIQKGQYEAASVLGISTFKTYARIIFPQVFVIQLPPLISEFINVIKMSPMISTIAVVELTRVGQRFVTSTYKPIPIYITLAVFYLVITTGLEGLVGVLERKLAKFKDNN